MNSEYEHCAYSYQLIHSECMWFKVEYCYNFLRERSHSIGGKKTHSVLIELLTSDKPLSPHIVSTVLSRVKKHIGGKTDQPLT